MLSGIIDIFEAFSNSFGVWKSLIFTLPENVSTFYACFSGLKKPCFQTSSAPMMSRTELYP